MFARLKNFGFTAGDITIILFLMISFIVGLVIKFSGREPAQEFNYSVQDREFEQSLKQAFNGADSKSLTPEQLRRINELNLMNDSLVAIKSPQIKGGKESAIHNKIKINSASAIELALLPGIGGAMAERIVDYRNSRGGFKSLTELMNIKGIGEKKYQKLKDYIELE